MAVREFPALGFDPAPGTPTALTGAGQSAASCAQSLGRSAETLNQMDTSTWVGEAADAFRTTLGDLPRDLDHATRAHDETAKALTEYGQALTGFQTRAADLEQQAEAAQRRQQAAIAEANRIAAIRVPSDDPRLTQLKADYETARTSAGNAGGELEQLRAQARTLRQQASDAARTAARRVRGATDPPYDKPGWLHRAWDATTQWIKDHADLLQKISGILKLVAGACGLLALIPGLQWLGAVALIAGGAALAIDLTVKLVAGKGSWGAIALDAVTMIPGGKLLGAGKALLGGEKALVGGERALQAGEGALAGGERALAAGEGALGSGERALSGGEGAARTAVGEAGETATPLAERVCATDPVDVATGQMVLAQTDVDLPGVLPLVLTRTHASSYRAGHWFGVSWASTVDQRLELDDEGSCLTTADGMVLEYPAVGADPVYPYAGPRWPLRATAEGYAVSDVDTGRTHHFAAVPGRLPGVLPLVAITDRGSTDRIDIDYTDTGAPAALRHSGGYHIAVDTAAGRVTALRLLHDGGETTLIRYGYDAAGHLTEITNSSARPLRHDYDPAGRVTGWIDRNHTAYRYVYDESGRCVRTEGTDGYLRAELRYHPDARRTEVTDSLGHTTTYRYNADGRVTHQTDPLGHTLRSDWDTQRRLTARTDALGRTTRWTYDDLGNLVAVVRPDGADLAVVYEQRQPVTITGAAGETWHRRYDGHDRLLSTVDPLGAGTTYAYDEAGHLVAVVDALGGTTTYRNDATGLPVEVIDPVGTTTRYERDAFGRIARVVGPLGMTARYEYTVEGRLIGRVLPDGGTEAWAYDGEGNLVAHTDAAGHTSTIEIGTFDLPAARTDATGARLAFGYDTERRLTSVTNPAGLVWTYDYDPAGRLVAETDFNGRALRYQLDAAGQLIARTNGVGETTTYARNSLGKVVEQRAGDDVAVFDYAPGGQLLAAHNADAEISYLRDPLGRILSETTNGRTLAAEYDPLGRRTRLRTPSGAENIWVFDAASRPVTLSAGGQTVQFGYDGAGREIERRFGPAASLTRTWDTSSRLATQTLVGPEPSSAGQRTLLHRSYSYTPDGYLAATEDLLSGPRGYELDPAGRITAVAGPQWTERYAYDATGNITDAAWPAADPDALGDRDVTGTLIRRAGRVRYEHDAQGRVLLRQHRRLTAKPHTWRYEWSADDRLIAVTTPDGSRWRYRYDPFGRRIAKELADTSGGVVERVDFTWDDTVLAEEVHSRPALDGPAAGRATTWTWQPGTHQAVTQSHRTPSVEAPQQWVDREFYAIITDLTGMPTELISADGAVAWQARASLWGDATTAGAADCPLRFPGQYRDAETLLHYNYQRYYDPISGQYQSPDPIGLAAAPNQHAYVPNPVALIDPLGLTPCNSDLFRGMTADGDVPKIGTSARTLGARPGVDIPVEPGGTVRPGTGGMSVSPDTPANLPPHRRPPDFGGTGRDPVWSTNARDLPDGLNYRPDPANPTGHGFIEPSRPMHIDEYQDLLGSTQGQWGLVTP